MEERCPRSFTRHPASCQLLFQGRAAGIIMAIPFVFCFTLFGIFNLVGGTVLTIMACKPKISKKGLELLRKMIGNADFEFEQQLDPMQVVGIILLLTGSLLVVIGISLGVVACRSVNEDKRRRKGIEEASLSGIPMSTIVERSSRRTSSSSFSPYASHRRGDRKKSFASENIASPILEVDSEEEDTRSWNHGTAMDGEPSTELHTVSFRENSSLKNRDLSFKVTWASDVGPSDSSMLQVVAEVSHSLQSCSSDSPKTLLTTDL